MKAIHARTTFVTRAGFTLVEMIVVIGIIVLLAALLLPMVGRSIRTAKRTKAAADLQAITNGLDAYRLDFKDIPRIDANSTVPGPFQGSALLCWALIAPGDERIDGATGYGFRLRGIQGQVYGPYITPTNFRMGTVTISPLVKPASPPFNTKTTCICLADGAGNAILYYPARTVTDTPTIDQYFGLVGNSPRYVADDNDPAIAGGTETGKNPTPAAVVQAMQSMMPGLRPQDGKLDQTQVLNLPYLLWDAGPDGRFGTSDDVTNFQR